MARGSTRASTWGGARAGAGRPAKHAIASEPHRPRPELAARHPVRVTARIQRGLGALSRRRSYAAVQRAVRTSLARTDFRIVHLAIRTSRLELLVEADDKYALARGMQGFQVAAARALNTALARRGTVFPDRYRAAILRTRASVRAAIDELSSATTSITTGGPTTSPGAPAIAPSSPLTWLLRIELGRVRPPPLIAR